MIVDKDLQNLVLTNTLFNGIPREQVKNHIKPKNFIPVAEGEIVFVSEDPVDEIYLIVEGEVKIKFSETNKKEYKYISDFFGEKEIQTTNVYSQIKENLFNKNFDAFNVVVEKSEGIPDDLVSNTKDEININFDEADEDMLL